MGKIIRTQIKLALLVAGRGGRGLTTEGYKERLGVIKLYYIYPCQNL